MTASDLQPPKSIRRMALLLCGLALLPISMGALVTTLKAGMAFADWPTSDGQNMLLYPWLKDLANPDKFTEHGHRLAGMLLGFSSILFVVATFRMTSIRWARVYSIVILLSVIGQGLLGGARVLMDRQLLAMLHSITGAMFFCLCAGFVLFSSDHWKKVVYERDDSMTASSAIIVLVLPALVFAQYILGSCFRHLHFLLYEHIGGAVLVTLASLIAIGSLRRSSVPSLNLAARLLMGSLHLQILLGLGAYATRLGIPWLGYVATSGSLAQAVVCSSHTVCGMFLLCSSTVSACLVARLVQNGRISSLSISRSAIPSIAEGDVA